MILSQLTSYSVVESGSFTSKNGNTRVPTFTAPTLGTVLEVLARVTRQEKEIQGLKSWAGGRGGKRRSKTICRQHNFISRKS